MEGEGGTIPAAVWATSNGPLNKELLDKQQHCVSKTLSLHPHAQNNYLKPRLQKQDSQ